MSNEGISCVCRMSLKHYFGAADEVELKYVNRCVHQNSLFTLSCVMIVGT